MMAFASSETAVGGTVNIKWGNKGDKNRDRGRETDSEMSPES